MAGNDIFNSTRGHSKCGGDEAAGQGRHNGLRAPPVFHDLFGDLDHVGQNYIWAVGVGDRDGVHRHTLQLQVEEARPRKSSYRHVWLSIFPL